jgi:hypothetical protein
LAPFSIPKIEDIIRYVQEQRLVNRSFLFARHN